MTKQSESISRRAFNLLRLCALVALATAPGAVFASGQVAVDDDPFDYEWVYASHSHLGRTYDTGASAVDVDYGEGTAWDSGAPGKVRVDITLRCGNSAYQMQTPWVGATALTKASVDSYCPDGLYVVRTTAWGQHGL
jgi:hypothetical protein